MAKQSAKRQPAPGGTKPKDKVRAGRTLEYALALRIVTHIGLSDPAIGLDVSRARNFLCDTLTRPPYDHELLGHHLYPHAQSIDSAADSFFSAVFERPIQVVRGEPRTKTHALLTARLACMSGQPAWRGAALTDLPPDDGRKGKTVQPFDPRLRMLQMRLAPLTAARGVGPGLRVGNLTLPLPAELSVWEAVALPPVAFHVPQSTSDRAQFLFALTAAFENAARPWKELVRAGLVPPGDWLESTKTNTIRALNQFRVLATTPPRALMEEAWTRHPVPGVATLDLFLDSPLAKRRGAVVIDPTREPDPLLAAQGAAAAAFFHWAETQAGPPGTAQLDAAWEVSPVPRFKSHAEVLAHEWWRRSVHQGWWSGQHGIDDPDAVLSESIPTRDAKESPDMNTTPHDTMVAMVADLHQQGVIDPLDAELLIFLLNGATLAELAKIAPLKARIKAINVSVDDYAKNLCARVAAHTEAKEREDSFEESPDDE